jgi:hypothetical protein
MLPGERSSWRLPSDGRGGAVERAGAFDAAEDSITFWCETGSGLGRRDIGGPSGWPEADGWAGRRLCVGLAWRGRDVHFQAHLRLLSGEIGLDCWRRRVRERTSPRETDLRTTPRGHRANSSAGQGGPDQEFAPVENGLRVFGRRAVWFISVLLHGWLGPRLPIPRGSHVALPFPSPWPSPSGRGDRRPCGGRSTGLRLQSPP